MKTIRQIFADALALDQKGQPLAEVSAHILRVSEENGHHPEGLHGAHLSKFTYPATGEVIAYDGHDWRYFTKEEAAISPSHSPKG